MLVWTRRSVFYAALHDEKRNEKAAPALSYLADCEQAGDFVEFSVRRAPAGVSRLFPRLRPPSDHRPASRMIQFKKLRTPAGPLFNLKTGWLPVEVVALAGGSPTPDLRCHEPTSRFDDASAERTVLGRRNRRRARATSPTAKAMLVSGRVCRADRAKNA
jgi:hypothetical protein